MSFSNIPNITPLVSVTVRQTVPLLLSSIAFEELALAYIMNAEAEKLQFTLGTLTGSQVSRFPADVSVADLINVQSSVQRTLRDVIKKEMLLDMRFENLLDHLVPLAASPAFQIFTYTGAVETTTVPSGVTTATIRAIGAAGGIGTSANGLGASIQGDFPVTPGETLSILVGQQGQTGKPSAYPDFQLGGGGGGSFVWRGTGPVTPLNLLVAAGGGGGACTVEANPGVNASITGNGTDGNPGGIGGSNGRGGGSAEFSAGGGAGILPGSLGDGGSFLGKGGQSIHDGGAGGLGYTPGSDGGFGGGGGGGFEEGGGGGGFSGGGAGGTGNSIGGGGGGGSKNNGNNQVNIAGVGAGNGQVTISYFG
ncbi:hypothetical protein [Bacillus sp. REN3]|uniref:hypothetical protein n=1 Tax=Bacillus sp. REN3 TaxID=2802440 RepID=UPI001AEE8BCA|nr:hypothetical protein [Bacillus sp. REN3]